jgi:xanthine dehydrogenase molybdenum-binding subunit
MPPLCYPKSKFRHSDTPPQMSQFPAPQLSALRVVGQSVTRVDARSKITGAAEFSGDRLSVENLLYGKTLRSPHAHAQIVAIDSAKAEALPGVRAVITYRDVPAIPFEAR